MGDQVDFIITQPKFSLPLPPWKSSGFLRTKLIAVNSSDFASTRSSYKSSVGWAGNLTSSVAVFELFNVKLKDSKKYGIVVEYGLQHTPLTDTVQLQVSK